MPAPNMPTLVQNDTIITPLSEREGFVSVLIRDKFKKPIEYGYYYQAKREGTWTTLYPSDSTLQSLAEYHANKKEGISLTFGENGGIEIEENYHNGLLHGIRRQYISNTRQKQLQEYYEQGVLHGKWQRFHINGKLAEECTYVHGKKDGTATWYYETGQILTVYHYQNGQIEGKVQSYYGDGKIKMETIFANNEMEGVSKTFYANAVLKVEGRYVRGKKDGIWTYYTEEGKISKTEKYKNGELLEEKVKIKP